jgi:hypothetical protein
MDDVSKNALTHGISFNFCTAQDLRHQLPGKITRRHVFQTAAEITNSGTCATYHDYLSFTHHRYPIPFNQCRAKLTSLSQTVKLWAQQWLSRMTNPADLFTHSDRLLLTRLKY